MSIINRSMRLNKLIKFGCLLILVFLMSCDDLIELDKNTEVGNKNLSINNIEPSRGLKLDTLVIFGGGFDPIAYQNQVVFTNSIRRIPYVDENGLVTDSIITIIEKSGTLAKVVDALPDRLKVIVPESNVTSGPVFVLFGVDTVASDEFFTLISNRPRPVIQAVNPAFGAPGEPISIRAIHLANPLNRKDSTLIRFGSSVVRIDTVGAEATMQVRVPGVFSGPADLAVGALTPSNDTLWSNPVNFGVLPSPDAPFTIASYQTINTTSILEGIIGSGRIEKSSDGNLVSLKDFQVSDGRFEFCYGLSLDTLNNRFYWTTRNINNRSFLISGNLNSGQADEFFLNVGEIDALDVEVRGNTLYVAGSDIRFYPIAPNGEIQSNQKIIWQNPNGVATITNLKIIQNRFYWVDRNEGNVYAANLEGGALSSPTLLYSSASIQELNEPVSIAIDDFRNLIYIADFSTEGDFIYRGNLDGSSTSLSVFYESEPTLSTFDGITDMEFDLQNEFLYFTSRNGIFRKSTAGSNANPVPIYSFPRPEYFDF